MNAPRHCLGRIRSLFASEEGTSATEYAILLAVLILGAMAAMEGIGSRVQNIYNIIDGAMPEM